MRFALSRAARSNSRSSKGRTRFASNWSRAIRARNESDGSRLPVAIDVGAHSQREHLLKECKAEAKRARGARKAKRLAFLPFLPFLPFLLPHRPSTPRVISLAPRSANLNRRRRDQPSFV